MRPVHSEIPQELLRLSRKGEVHVNMEDHRHEEYVPPPKPKLQAFSGTGHKLGRLVSSSQFTLALQAVWLSLIVQLCFVRGLFTHLRVRIPRIIWVVCFFFSVPLFQMLASFFRSFISSSFVPSLVRFVLLITICILFSSSASLVSSSSFDPSDFYHFHTGKFLH